MSYLGNVDWEQKAEWFAYIEQTPVWVTAERHEEQIERWISKESPEPD